MSEALAVQMKGDGPGTLTYILSAVFFAVALYFGHRACYGMLIEGAE